MTRRRLSGDQITSRQITQVNTNSLHFTPLPITVQPALLVSGVTVKRPMSLLTCPARFPIRHLKRTFPIVVWHKMAPSAYPALDLISTGFWS